MNFYKHHIGDYAQATSHLSFVEDAAYSRLIRKYYAEEKPLPADIKSVQRLVGARSKEERQAVEDVLNEFFDLESDGWHNKRCDEELAANHELEIEREAKNANERERQRRHREERARLFDELRKHDIVPAYDTKTETLRALLDNVQVTSHVTRDNTSMSQHVTEPVTRNATANQTPDTRHHIKTLVGGEDISHTSPVSPTSQFPMFDDWIPSDSFPSLCKSAGLTAKPTDDQVQEFRTYWLTQPDRQRTQSEWEHALIKSCKAGAARNKLNAVKQNRDAGRLAAAKSIFPQTSEQRTEIEVHGEKLE